MHLVVNVWQEIFEIEVMFSANSEAGNKCVDN